MASILFDITETLNSLILQTTLEILVWLSFFLKKSEGKIGTRTGRICMLVAKPLNLKLNEKILHRRNFLNSTYRLVFAEIFENIRVVKFSLCLFQLI